MKSIFYILLSIILIVVYATYVAQQRSKEMLIRYEQDEMYKIKHNLKNFVDVEIKELVFGKKIEASDKDLLKKLAKKLGIKNTRKMTSSELNE